MKTNDQQLLEEAYEKVAEVRERDYFKDALINPSLYELDLYRSSHEDWDGNTVYSIEATISTADSGIQVASKVYEEGSIYEEELDRLIASFKKHNPEGINGQR